MQYTLGIHITALHIFGGASAASEATLSSCPLRFAIAQIYKNNAAVIAPSPRPAAHDNRRIQKFFVNIPAKMSTHIRILSSRRFFAGGGQNAAQQAHFGSIRFGAHKQTAQAGAQHFIVAAFRHINVG